MEKNWIRVASAAELPEGGTLQVACAGELVCLYRLEGQVYATQDLCTHGAASLADGYIDGDKIECPYHQGLFHIPTGKAVGAPCTIDLKAYEAKTADGDLLIRI